MPATPDDDTARPGPARSEEQPTVRLPPRRPARPERSTPDSASGDTANHATVRLPSPRPSTRRGAPKPPGGGAGSPGRGPGTLSGRGAPDQAGRGRRAPLVLAATVTTGWAALVSIAPMMLVVLLAFAVDNTEAPATRVLRAGLAAWLLAHGVPLRTGLGSIGLIPLALTVLAAWRVIRAGVHTARAVSVRRAGGPWPALRVGLAVGAVYGVLGAAAALAARIPGLSVPLPRAAITLAAVGAAGGTFGALIESRQLRRFVVRLPGPIRDGLRAGTVAACLVLGAGAALAGTAVALSGGEASQMIADYHTGVAGQAGLTLVCLVYAPNVATWAASYLVGPGFLLGAQTTVSAAQVTLGPLPAVPMLAGLPSGPASGVGALLLVVPLAAGMAAGWLLVRRRIREGGEMTWGRVLGAAALAGPLAGMLLGLASVAASGPLGGGRLAQIGPRALPVALVATVIVTLGSITAASARLLIGARRRQSE